MNATQILTIVLASAPTTLVVLIGILLNNSRLTDTNNRIADLNAHIGDVDSRIDHLRSDMNTRFEEMKDLWRSELHRVEEVLDARLKHIEER
jgi:cell division protein FtsL